MLRTLILAAGVFFATVMFSYATVLDGVVLPDTLTIGDEALQLNGAGLRVKNIGPIHKGVYVAALYLKEKCCDFNKIINADETMVLRLNIVTSLVTSERFANQTLKGFTEVTQGNIAPIQNGINDFLSVFAEEINDGDLFEIVYQKGVGIQVFKNGSKESKITITGLPIKSALFGIWLGHRSEKSMQVLAKNLLDVH